MVIAGRTGKWPPSPNILSAPESAEVDPRVPLPLSSRLMTVGATPMKQQGTGESGAKALGVTSLTSAEVGRWVANAARRSQTRDGGALGRGIEAAFVNKNIDGRVLQARWTSGGIEAVVGELSAVIEQEVGSKPTFGVLLHIKADFRRALQGCSAAQGPAQSSAESPGISTATEPHDGGLGTTAKALQKVSRQDPYETETESESDEKDEAKEVCLDSQPEGDESAPLPRMGGASGECAVEHAPNGDESEVATATQDVRMADRTVTQSRLGNDVGRGRPRREIRPSWKVREASEEVQASVSKMHRMKPAAGAMRMSLMPSSGAKTPPARPPPIARSSHVVAAGGEVIVISSDDEEEVVTQVSAKFGRRRKVELASMQGRKRELAESDSRDTEKEVATPRFKRERKPTDFFINGTGTSTNTQKSRKNSPPTLSAEIQSGGGMPIGGDARLVQRVRVAMQEARVAERGLPKKWRDVPKFLPLCR